MFQDAIGDFLPVLTEEEQRMLAVTYAVTQVACTTNRINCDWAFRRILPGILQRPEMLVALFQVAKTRSFFGVPVMIDGDPHTATSAPNALDRAVFLQQILCFAADSGYPLFRCPNYLLPIAELLTYLPPHELIRIAAELAVNSTSTLASGAIVSTAPSTTLALGPTDGLPRGMHSFLTTILSVADATEIVGRGYTWQHCLDIAYHLTGSGFFLLAQNASLTVNSQFHAISGETSDGTNLTTVEFLMHWLRKSSESENAYPFKIVVARDESEREYLLLTAHGSFWRESLDGKATEYIAFSSTMAHWLDASTGTWYPPGTVSGFPEELHAIRTESGGMAIPAKVLVNYLRALFIPTGSANPSSTELRGRLHRDPMTFGALQGPYTLPIPIEEEESDEFENTDEAPSAPESNEAAPATPIQESTYHTPKAPRVAPEEVSRLQREQDLKHATTTATIPGQSQQSSGIISNAFWWGADREKSFKGGR